MTEHTRRWRETELRQLKELLGRYRVVAVADLSRFPASLFQGIRKKLAGKAVVRVSKTKVIKRALEEGGRPALKDYARESCALIFTEMNPFELFAFLKKNKGSMAAKTGMIAGADIIIPAGDTGLPPGPALSDLKQAGLNVRIQGSTIAVAEDKVVTKAGEAVTAQAAAALAKLGIKPVKVGLGITAAAEGSQIYEAGVLDIDTEHIFQEFADAHRRAFNLACSICYFTPATTELLIGKAFREARMLALEAELFNAETMPELIARANRQASALKAMVPKAG